jgi:hypothetical protein
MITFFFWVTVILEFWGHVIHHLERYFEDLSSGKAKTHKGKAMSYE